MNRKHSRKGRTGVTVEELREIFGEPNTLGEVRMLSIHPQHGVKMVYGFELEACEIFEDDTEAMFYLHPENIFLSCSASDLIHIGKHVYLMGSGIAYKLGRDDDYRDMSTDDMAEACLDLFERMQRVKMGAFCFPVIDLTDKTKEDEDNEEE